MLTILAHDKTDRHTGGVKAEFLVWIIPNLKVELTWCLKCCPGQWLEHLIVGKVLSPTHKAFLHKCTFAYMWLWHQQSWNCQRTEFSGEGLSNLPLNIAHKPGCTDSVLDHWLWACVCVPSWKKKKMSPLAAAYPWLLWRSITPQ